MKSYLKYSAKKKKENRTKTKQNNSMITLLSQCNFHFSCQQERTSSGFNMVPGAISIIYFCLKKERKELVHRSFRGSCNKYVHTHICIEVEEPMWIHYLCAQKKKVLLHYFWIAYVSFSLEICKYWLCKSITFLHLSSIQPTHFSNCRQLDVCSKIQNDSGTFLKHIRLQGIPVYLLHSWTDIQLAFLVQQWHFCYLLYVKIIL